MSATSARRTQIIFITVVLVLEGALAVVLSNLYASLNNSLIANGRWESRKLDAEMPLMGAVQFVSTPQTLANEKLNLGRWHGYQEILYREPVLAREIAFEFTLERDAYVVVEFDRDEERFAGVRLSSNQGFPSQYFTARADGEFLTVEPLAMGLVEPDVPTTCRIVFGPEAASIELDGRPCGTLPIVLHGERRFGFRGSIRDTFLDNVSVRHGDPAETIEETFFNRRDFARCAVGLAVLFASIDLVILLLFRSGVIASTKILFSGVTVLLVLLLGAGLGFVAYRKFLANVYPTMTAEVEREWQRKHERDVVGRIKRELAGRTGEDARRILFMGSSQTWGSGAARRDETFVIVLERLLNERARGERYVCINSGVSGSRAHHLYYLYEGELLNLEPDLCVVHLSFNDYQPSEFSAALDRFAALGRARGVDTIFSIEPSSTERKGVNEAMRSAMRAASERHGVPLVDTYDAMRKRRDDGFLWWDMVHPTSFGHRLIAETLVGPIEDALEGRPRRAAPKPR